MPPAALRRGVLSTDAYQLTMAQLYLRMGLHERRVRFEHFFRSNPDYGGHAAGFCVAAGLGPFTRWMTTVRARPQDVDALRTHRTRHGGRLFDETFCEWFASVDFSGLRVAAVPEGRVVHPNTPITVVDGPLGTAQLIETPLLNQLNFATLIATKATRVVEAAGGRPVLEFGMRRAPSTGADTASRAAIVGGAVATSNSAVAYELGRTPSGTHAHSMIQLFIALGEGEQAAFDAYADVYPDDTLLLLDTVDTLGSGLPNAIRTFERLRSGGHTPVGVRLDSGDLAFLSVAVGVELDRAGFPDASIVLTSRLDEMAIWQITSQIVDEAARAGVDADAIIGRLVFGVGSSLATSDGDPSLDGVYKLVAVDDRTGGWAPAIKRSDSAVKVLNPGAKRVWRAYDQRGMATADVLSGATEVLAPGSHHLTHHARREVARWVEIDAVEELLVPLVDGGDVIADGGVDGLDDVDAAGRRRRADIDRLDPGVRRLVSPHAYHVSITDEVLQLKQRLLAELA
ncbi:MAG: nicotinate phosphoribosyltransferase [Ilumatobacteraceae bacterium]